MRSLHSLGAVVLSTNYRGDAYWKATMRSVKPMLVPIILEPVGREVLWIDRTACTAAVKFRDLASKHGWWAGLSYSRFLDPPPVSGERKGRWVEKEMIAVRLRHAGRALVGFGAWQQVEGGSWGFESAGMLAGGRISWLLFGQLDAIVRDVPYVPPKPREKRKKPGLDASSTVDAKEVPK